MRPDESRWCEHCTPAMESGHLPPKFGSCSLCTGSKAREFLLADPRANRVCPVCELPLPKAAVHLKTHYDCRPGDSDAA